MKIERWFKRAKVGSKSKRYKLHVNPELGEILTKGKVNRIQKLRKELKLDIELIKDDKLPPEAFQIFSPDENADVTGLFGRTKNKQ